MWMIARLPYPVQLILGGLLGKLMYWLMPERKRIARINIGLCFPELDESERNNLLKKNFKSLGIGIIELAMTWWGPGKRLRRLVQIEGIEHLQNALKKGKGALLLSAHFTTLEIGSRLITFYQPIAAMYRRYKNPLFGEILKRVRNNIFESAVLHSNVRGLVSCLKKNLPVWYAPDQNYQRRYCIFVPFFNIPTATITATSRIARLSGAEVIPFFQERLPGTKGYKLRILPALKDFPSGDDVADTTRINKLIEDEVRRLPEQYFWVHQRFKKMPDSMESRYKVNKNQ
jgi:Kdo2-lipid IVA lauroyltransferase/acyltransferase